MKYVLKRPESKLGSKIDDGLNIELNLTYRCNRKCENCHKYCNMQDTGIEIKNLDMELDQVYRFIGQVKRTRTHLNWIPIIGGEALLHPKIVEVCDALLTLKKENLVRRLIIVTNGTVKVPKIIKSMEHIEVQNQATMEQKKQKHKCVFVAPIDFGKSYGICNYYKACGMMVGAYGYFPCINACSLCMMFGITDVAKLELPRSQKEFGDITKLCRLCPYNDGFVMRQRKYGRLISKTYKKAMNTTKNIDLLFERL